MLFKKKDEWARPIADYDVITALPDSVVASPLGLAEHRQAMAKVANSATDAEAVAAEALAAAPKAALPATLSPQLATLASAPPQIGDWVYEIKFDGYRILARIDARPRPAVHPQRQRLDRKMESLAREVAALGIKQRLARLRSRRHGRERPAQLQRAAERVRPRRHRDILLYVFDVPYLDGKDLRSAAVARSARDSPVSACRRPHRTGSASAKTFAADGASVLESACKMGLEGVMAKRLDAPYDTRRTETWLKLKCHHRQEFVIGGFTDRSDGGMHEVGSLLLGVYDDEGDCGPPAASAPAGVPRTARRCGRAREARRQDVPVRCRIHADQGPLEPTRQRQRALGHSRRSSPK